MSFSDLAKAIDRARDGMDNAVPIARKTDLVTRRADDVMRRQDERSGDVRAAQRRERQRLNAGVASTAKRIAIAVGIISLLTVVIGIIVPIGMFGFLAAVGIALAAAGLLAFGGAKDVVAPTVSPDLPNGQMVQQFDSYIYRTRRLLTSPAQAEVDAMSAMLPSLRQTLERVPDNDPNAQDARRLMSKHLPGLIDSYLHVPSNYRAQSDADGNSADQRLVEALAAGREALKDIGDTLARNDLNKFETQGRFIETRYKEAKLD
ncbi:MAG: hypothetical protein ABI667_04150 [Sphingomicrobium sp.]